MSRSGLRLSVLGGLLAAACSSAGRPTVVEARPPPSATARADTREPESRLDAILRAQADADLPAFYAKSREFLARFPDHSDADAVRYDLALQLIAENLSTPKSAEAAEARKLLDVVAARGREALRFDAALVRLKFALPEERVRLTEVVLERFAKHPDLDQVFAWWVGVALETGDIETAGRWARRLLAHPGAHDPEGQFRDVARRAALIGAPLPANPIVKPRPGKVVLIDFFASWCAPCAAEVPRLLDLDRRAKSRGLEIVGVSLDEDEAAHRAFVTRMRIPWPTARSPRGTSGLADACGIGDLPTYLVIDRAGRVRATDLRGDRLSAFVETLLRP